MNKALLSGFYILTFLYSTTSVSAQDIQISASDNFQLHCPAYLGTCDAPEALKAAGDQVVFEMERIRNWFDLLGFPQQDLLQNDGEREILLTGRSAKDACGGEAAACHRIEALGRMSRLWLPLDRLDSIGEETGTLAHEYLHSRQPGTDAGSANWLREAVATAVGEAWNIKNGRGSGIYPPIYRLSLDLPFYYNDMTDLSEDAGYRNWLYLLHLGEKTGSQDHIAHLADDAFMNDHQYSLGRNPADAMKPFYDAAAINGASFNKIFPKFVSNFNNLDHYADGMGGLYYYSKVQEETFTVPGAFLIVEDDYQGNVAPYAAAPLHLKLDMRGGDADLPPQDRLALAEVEITDGDFLDDLTLVAEHRMGETQHKTSWLVDGSDPPEEMGLYRIVHAPQALDTDRAASAFTLQARMNPVEVSTPICFQQGMTEAIEFTGFDATLVQNWRLTTDNGTVNGLEITPEKAGEISITLEIDSPITRQSGSLAPAKPRTTQVALGTFPVTSETCMIRLTTTIPSEGRGAVMTFSYDGEYSEMSAEPGTAIYWSANDMIFYTDGHWQNLPPQVKAMMLPKLMEGIGLPDALAPGEDEVALGGIFFGRMPHAFSKRFSWSTLKTVPGADGKPVRRKRAECPRKGEGCTTATFVMDGQPMIPVIFDPHGRPAKVTFNNGGESAIIEFEYGNWPIRRPPGW